MRLLRLPIFGIRLHGDPTKCDQGCHALGDGTAHWSALPVSTWQSGIGRWSSRPCSDSHHGVVAHYANSCHTSAMDATVVLGPQGRIVIPAEVRATMGLAPGDRLHLRVTGSQLVLERPQDAIVELRSLARQIPKSRSLVDELLAERRLAATAE